MPRLDFYVDYDLQATIRLTKPEVLIGRESACDVCIPDGRVSRLHAVVRAVDDGHEIENRGAHGTKVNGVRLHEPRRLQPMDVIFISRYVLIYQSDDAEAVENASTIL